MMLLFSARQGQTPRRSQAAPTALSWRGTSSPRWGCRGRPAGPPPRLWLAPSTRWHWTFYIFMTCTKQIFSLPQIGYPSMDERERREINNTTMGYEEVRDNKDTRGGSEIQLSVSWSRSGSTWPGPRTSWSGSGGKLVIMSWSPQEPMLMPWYTIPRAPGHATLRPLPKLINFHISGHRPGADRLWALHWRARPGQT